MQENRNMKDNPIFYVLLLFLGESRSSSADIIQAGNGSDDDTIISSNNSPFEIYWYYVYVYSYNRIQNQSNNKTVPFFIGILDSVYQQ